MDTDKLNEIGFADWNKKSLDELVQHLEREFMFSSSGTAKAIFTLIEYYHKTKQLNKPVVMQGLPTTKRVEVIDEKGRSYVNWESSNKVELSMQDEGRTLKVFISQGSPTVGKAGEDASVSDGK